MMKKEKKIMIVVEPDPEQRRKLIKRLAVKLGFARTPSDAAKIIRTSPWDFDLATAYFVLADTYDLKSSPMTTSQLYQMASSGIAVIVGTKKIPAEYEFLCQTFLPEDI